MWRSWPQLEQKSLGGGGRGNGSSLSRHGVPVTSLTVRGWKLLAATVTGDAWLEICLRCSLWGQNAVTHAPHTWEGFINHLHQTERHSNYFVLFWFWLRAVEVVFSATLWGLHPVQCTCSGSNARRSEARSGKENQMWWVKVQPATVRVLAAAYATCFIMSQWSDYFRQANKHLTLVWLKHLYTRMWRNGRTAEGTTEPMKYHGELLNECAVHRPNY